MPGSGKDVTEGNEVEVVGDPLWSFRYLGERYLDADNCLCIATAFESFARHYAKRATARREPGYFGELLPSLVQNTAPPYQYYQHIGPLL